MREGLAPLDRDPGRRQVGGRLPGAGARRETAAALMWRLGVVALLLALSAPAAHAHATLLAAEPADGAVLARAPSQLRLTFDEPVSPLAPRLVGAGGHSLPLTAVSQHGASLVITPPPMAEG